MNQTDYRKYYDSENYLLKEVGQGFRITGKLKPADFYTILSTNRGAGGIFQTHHYESFKGAVIDQTPSHVSLRDKDRFLSGRSIRNSIESECQS
jgi:hypothetical protein